MLLRSPRSAFGPEPALSCAEVATRGGTGVEPLWTCHLCSAPSLQPRGFVRTWAQGGVSVSDGGGRAPTAARRLGTRPGGSWDGMAPFPPPALALSGPDIRAAQNRPKAPHRCEDCRWWERGRKRGTLCSGLLCPSLQRRSHLSERRSDAPQAHADHRTRRAEAQLTFTRPVSRGQRVPLVSEPLASPSLDEGPCALKNSSAVLRGVGTRSCFHL